MPSNKSNQGFLVVHPHAAGIDIGATFHIVAVSPDRDSVPVRKFQSFTTDLHRLSQWLCEMGITSIAMESAGVYWVPVFEILESDGFEVILVNAREVKQVPEGKLITTMHNGSRDCINSGYCGPVSVPVST